MFENLNIESGMFISAAYNAEDEILQLNFRNAPEKMYYYDNFPAADLARFMDADSKGTHFARNIRGQYNCRIEAA